MYKGKDTSNGKFVAMKFIIKNNKSKKDMDSFYQEINILKRIQHQNIIQLLDTFETSKEICVITGNYYYFKNI